MAYADPQSVTVNSVAQSLPRIASPAPTTQGVFSTADGTYTYAVRQNSTKDRFRREIRFTQRKVATDPIAAVQKEVSASIIIAVDEPKWGFSDTELGYLIAGVLANLSASSGANQAKLLGGEL